MGKIFDLDSPVMRFLSRMADLMILNLLMTVCCLPVFTIGAANTAMHYVMLKMVRGEEGYIVKDFFKSFKMNFKQATVIWLIMILFILVFAGDYMIMTFSGINFPRWVKIAVMAVGILLLIVSSYIFPVLSHFDNTVKNTIKNGCIMSIMAVPKAIAMVFMGIIPVAMLVLAPRLIPLVLLFGIALPGYLSAWMYSGTFKKFEPEDETQGEEEEFHVVLDDGEEPVNEDNGV